MAAARIVIHIDPQHAAKEPEIGALGLVEVVGLAAFVSDTHVEESVLSEEHAAAGMP